MCMNDIRNVGEITDDNGFPMALVFVLCDSKALVVGSIDIHNCHLLTSCDTCYCNTQISKSAGIRQWQNIHKRRVLGVYKAEWSRAQDHSTMTL